MTESEAWLLAEKALFAEDRDALAEAVTALRIAGKSEEAAFLCWYFDKGRTKWVIDPKGYIDKDKYRLNEEDWGVTASTTTSTLSPNWWPSVPNGEGN